MPITNEDLQLFEIIYANNHDKSMEFVQQEVLKAKMALLKNNEILAAKSQEPEKKVQAYVELTKNDLAIKTRSEIDAAIGDKEIICCICRKPMKSLSAHLKRFHHVDPKDYIRVCGYPEDIKLMAKDTLKKARAIVQKAFSMRGKKVNAE